MLPLLQLNPHAVTSPSSNLTPFPPGDASSSNRDPTREPAPWQPRSFPIRTAQPSLQSLGHSSRRPSYTFQPEHHLRRKTPNGTIDAGYDGSPTQASHGPPPLKHLVLPGQAAAIPPTGVLASSFQQVVPLGYHHSPSPFDPSYDDEDQLGPTAASSWPYHHDASFQNDMYFAGQHARPQNQLHQSGFGHDPVGVFPGAYPPLMRAYEHNVRAFCPPPATMNDPFSLGHMPIYHPPSWSSRVARPSSTPISTNVWAPNASSIPYQESIETMKPIPPGPVEMDAPFPPSHPTYAFHERVGSVVPARPRTLLQPDGFSGQQGFRDKVVLQAHRSYTELLLHLQRSRRAQFPKPSGFSTQPRAVVYPKPPKPSLSIYSAIGDSVTSQSERSAIDTSLLSHNMSPIETARSSLSMLSSLCEQSGWKWIDGMLLGGCLHYGLENYEKAREWFERIVSLDSSHAEAITNMAAALYCLNRQDQAEEQWLRAINVKPSCLEAAEHLVGLLYRKRSREAVDIISYVQKALRLPSHGPISAHSVEHKRSNQDNASRVAPSSRMRAENGQTCPPGAFTHGDAHVATFGSSGYALPARDNGRILALIHAKGTILYSLKDVDRASEAFEEAVSISVGRQLRGIQDLVRRIKGVLSPAAAYGPHRCKGPQTLKPLLLPPERARHTAKLVFGGNGELPGLQYVPSGNTKRTAVQTTSNSLLSLAKIFQDSLSSGHVSSDNPRRPSGVEDILVLYYLSLSLQESPSTANNVGILLAGVQQTTSEPSESGTPALPAPEIPGIKPGSGLALALAYYHYGLRLDPKHVHLHTNLGSLLKDIGQLDLAIQMYEQAVHCDGTFDIALTNLANAVKDRGKIKDAIEYYKRAVKANPDFTEAVCGLSTALNSVCDWRSRGGVVLSKGKYDRWHVDDRGLLVDSLLDRQEGGLTSRVVSIVQRQLLESSFWGRGILQDQVIADLLGHLRGLHPDSFDLKKALGSWAGKPWEGSRVVRLVERAVRVSQRKWYHDQYVTGARNASGYKRPQLPAQLPVPSAPTVLPFHTFTCPLSARDIRSISQRNAIRISCSTLRLPWIPAIVHRPPPPPSPHLNVGYVSSDFNNHPLAHLMQSVFGLHNPQRVRAYCYATTASDKSIHRKQIEQEAPVFRDVSTWPSEKFVQQIIEDQIHVLVNLNGYTRGARNEIFAARPAPVQMAFMGFAGSLGAEWCDYILADSTAIPPETLRPWRMNVGIQDVFMDDTEGEQEGWMYSENVIFCRDTFFCCDHAQSCEAGERQVTWAEEQSRRWKMRKELFGNLSDDTIIMGNFNQLYKIEPTTFRAWLRILAQVPKSRLWLLRFPEPGEAHLRRTARAWAGEEVASRLIFTDVAPKNQHISRARVCDLFLDTPECNAHTTAADVLWSSTPLLTLPRYPYKMCSRMAASILKGALPKTSEGQRAGEELIAGSEEDYEQRAVRLAGGLTYTISSQGYGQGRGRLAEIRKLLWENKWKSGLFDTRRWVDDVERAYEEAWRRWVQGQGGDICL